MKVPTSRLSTNQLIQLSQQVLNPSDMRHVGALMRAHVSGSTPNWNREELIAFLTARNGGTPPDQILENMASAQVRKEVETKQPVQQDGVVLRVIDLSQQGKAPAPSPLALYAHACNGGCGVRLALPLGEIQANAKSCWCANCQPKAQKRYDVAVALKASFVTKMAGAYYDHPQNDQIFNAEIQRRGLVNPTLGDLVEMFVERRADMLLPLTDADVRGMDSSELAKRIAIDPACGGANLAKAKEGQNRGEQQIHSTNETRLRPFAAEGTSGRQGWV